MAGTAQVVRIRRQVEHLRKGQVFKKTDEVVFGVTSFLPEEKSPDSLLDIARQHWSIEKGQFHRRDRTQREDDCSAGHWKAATNLSLIRSLTIFLFTLQSTHPRGNKSLPDYQRHIHRHPWGLIRRLTEPRHEE